MQPSLLPSVEDLVRRDLEIAALRHRRSWPIGASLRALKRKIKKSLSRTPKNPLFDADWYLEKYPDVAVLGLDPYAHYLMFGAHEGRNPNPSVRHQLVSGALSGREK